MADQESAGSGPRPGWIFRERDFYNKHRDPIQGEFFSTDAIADVTDALVREAIQNSLDASTGPGAVVVRFAIGTANPEVADRYLDGLWEHVGAVDPETADDLRGNACRYLTIEDFGTTGLRGDASQMFEEEGQDPPNDFFYFFRAEGKSGKSGADRGRWGVGKYVFPMASSVNTFFAVTARADDPVDPLLMGQAVLKNHRIGPKHFTPDGWFALETVDGPLPADDATVTASFRADWGLQRSDEPGLSVVVPHVAETATSSSLTEALVTDYFGALLGESLAVTIEEEGSSTAIDASSFEAAFASIDADAQQRVRPFVELFRHGLSTGTEVLTLNTVEGNPKWRSELLPEELLQRLRDALLEPGGRAVVRVPVTIKRKSPASTDPTWFDVLLEADPGVSTKAQFLREGIRVTEVDSGTLQGVHALVVITDRPLARMLGDAEGPAHTTWSARTEKFVGQYAYGQQWISFIRRAPREILRLLHTSDDQEDRTLAAQFFPVPSQGPVRTPVPAEDDDGKVTPPPPPLPPGPGKPRIDPLHPNGFRVTLPESFDAETVRISLGYDVRRGNPLTKWRAEDFTVGDLTIDVAGGEVIAAEDNQLEVSVSDRDKWSIRVTGFDRNRDLYVVAHPEGPDE